MASGSRLSVHSASQLGVLMPFERGNRFWEARCSNKGAAPLFEDPEDLKKACIEYFEWVEANPLQAAEKVTFQGHGNTFPVDKMRAMTIVGLCNFIGIARRTWYTWKGETGSSRDDVLHIIEWAEDIIFQQKFEGAAADLLNSNIIARELGLADKKEMTGSIAILDSDDRDL